MHRLALLPLAGTIALTVFAQRGSNRPAPPPGPESAPPAAAAPATPPPKVEEKTSKTEHSMQLNGQTIKYTAVAGTILTGS